MNNEEKRPIDKLREKIYFEFEEIRDKYLNYSPRDILDRSYAYVIAEDIVDCIQYNDIPDKQIEALLLMNHPLQRIIMFWSEYGEHESNYMKEILKTIEDCARNN